MASLFPCMCGPSKYMHSIRKTTYTACILTAVHKTRHRVVGQASLIYEHPSEHSEITPLRYPGPHRRGLVLSGAFLPSPYLHGCYTTAGGAGCPTMVGHMFYN